MCGRYTLMEDAADMEAWFDAVMEGFENFTPNYNVAPSHRMPVVGENKSRGRTIQPFRWGLLPFWAKEKKVGYSMINARAESVDSKKSFSKSFERYRCLVPASGFYEWKGEKGNKTPFYIYPTHEKIFAFAGIYNVWESPEGEKVPSYSIITTEANEKMSKLHDRMPVMLLKEEWEEWLDPDNHNTKSLKELLNPFPDDAIDFHQVDRKVGKVSNNSPDLIEATE
ncbi:Putative SOS response-associated peptidase YedK [Fodinibius roseus]|uniref:Abasic site processing protein n=1 Tax=Fodinibius roseus TaxID=1194090 RepID=A0A1M5L3K1_9BACT|nr:SOS response-associated peptidase [Fodinibius roseus]SHG59525.1 Putative SOS response-associated peptidase YedK [Fodinibius roseus]